MNLGISEGDFWDLNITKLRPYLIAEELRLKEMNYQCWLQGLYINNAVTVAVNNCLNSTKINYLEKPLPLTEKEQEEEAKAKQERMKAKFKAYAESLRGQYPCKI